MGENFSDLIDIKKHYNVLYSHGHARIIKVNEISAVIDKYGPDLNTYEGLTIEEFNEANSETFKKISEPIVVVIIDENQEEIISEENETDGNNEEEL